MMAKAKPIAQEPHVHGPACEQTHEHPPAHVHDRDCGHDHDPQEAAQPYRREEPKIGRNDPCHCGSGKKYNEVPRRR